MNRKTGLLISIFIALALGLSTSAFAFSGTGYSIIYVQSCSSTDPSSCTSDATCQTAGNYWCGGSGGSGPCVSTSAMTSCPGASPSPRPSYSCPSPSSFACPPDTTSKLITPTSAGCPYYVCEAPSTSPTPTSVGSCTTSAPGYCTSQPTCETVGNYWCKSSVGGEYCVQSSSKTSCPGYTASPSPFYEPCNKGGPISSKCTCGPSGTLYTYGYCCGDVSSVGTWYAGSCETSTPSPTFSCTPSTPQHCSTIQACQGIGGKWNTATNQCEGSTSGSCSSNTPGYCITQPTCESAGNYWCKTIYGNPYCIQLSTKSACPESSVSPSPIPSTGPCVASTPWYCVTEPTCTGVGGYWNRNTGYCEAKYQSPYPSPTYSPKPEVCSKEQFWICKTESDCKAIGAFWNQGYCSDRPPACSAKEPWSCYDGASCKGAGANWCEYAPGKGTNFCSQYECPGQKCSVKEPWNCYDDSSCKAAGANWCKNQYGGTDWCQSYSCPIIVPTPKICPAIYSPPKICGPGEEYVPTFDNNGCSTGGNCIKRDTCPYEWKPVCGVDGKTYQNSCKAKTVGVGIDHDGECGYKLKCDDSFVEEHATKCTKYGGTPEKYTRPDGCTDIWCKNAKPQPTPTIDPRCKVVEDTLTGVKRFDCGGRVQECKTLSESERTYLKDKCYANGGKPDYKKDYNGCEYLGCTFDDRNKFKFEGCPTDNQVKAVEEKCNRLGLKTDYQIIPVTRGDAVEQCKIARCEQSKDRVCPPLPVTPVGVLCPTGTVEKIVIGENGCDILKCVPQEEVNCKPLPPSEAFSGCKEKGGELVVKQDEKGCVVLEECVRRGNEDEIEFEEVDDVPEPGELLSLALKLEKVSISLKEFSKKIDLIAKYYEKSGANADAERYKRVKGLLASAGDELNKIRTEMRDKLDKLTKADVESFKYRLKYIAKVTLKDVLYLMLGGEVAKKDVLKTQVCGSDFSCFDKALRNCQPATMKVQFSADLAIGLEIAGLENDLCVAKATGDADSMTCKVKDYALGISNPEVNLMPFCEGTLKAKLEAAQKTPQPPTVATTPVSGTSTTTTAPTTATTSPAAGTATV